MTERSLNERVLELEAKVKRLSVEVSKTKVFNVAMYKESSTYKLDLKAITGLFHTKERIKLQRLLQKLHQIEDMSILEKIDKELIFSRNGGAKEGGEEVT